MNLIKKVLDYNNYSRKEKKMPGMLSGPVRERRKFYNRAFLSGWGDYNARNEGADQII